MKVICSGCHETMDPVEFNDHALKCTIPVREGESFEDYKKRSNQAKKRKGKGKLMPKMSERDFHHVSDLFRFLRTRGWSHQSILKVLTISQKWFLDRCVVFDEEDKPKVYIPAEAVETPVTLKDYISQRFGPPGADPLVCHLCYDPTGTCDCSSKKGKV